MAEGVVPPEDFGKKTMLVEEAGGDSGVANIQPTRVTEAEPASPATVDKLLSMISQSERNLEADRSRSKPRIQRVPELLRKTEKNKGMFDPGVVALGPIHHGRPYLRAMEEHKKVSAKQFAADSSHSIDMFYNKVRGVVAEARKCYAGNFDLYNDDEFAVMMFFDACFLLHFIDLSVKNRTKERTTSSQLSGTIIRDMFMLENQIPFIVLEAVMSLKHVNIFNFVDRILTSQIQTEPFQPPPFHLLDLLRTSFLGPQVPLPVPLKESVWPTFRSATELNEVGIRFTTSWSDKLRDIIFREGCIHGWLSLPQIVIDDLTTSFLLNLIAFEMCPDNTSQDQGITSYVWFLGRLIHRPEDVKELRSKAILLNDLGTDEQVAEFFNQTAWDVAPDSDSYNEAINGINNHLQKKARVYIMRKMHDHFRSPWVSISVIAAVFLFILTVTQTVFTVFPRK